MRLPSKRFFPVLCSSILFLSVRDFVFMRYEWSQHIVPVRHIPEWLPWFSYKPLARVGHELGIQVLYPPIRFVKESMVRDCVGIRLSLQKLPTKSVVA